MPKLTKKQREEAQTLYEEWQYWVRRCDCGVVTGSCHSDTLHRLEAWGRFAPWFYRGFKPDDYPKNDEPDYDKVY